LLLRASFKQHVYQPDHIHLTATTVLDQFESWAAGTPNSIAIEFEQQSITYGSLNSRANGLALRLSELGIGPGAIVGLCLERSVEMVVGVLGILKTGAAYLPLDPANPQQRVAFMLNDSGAAALVSQQRQAELIAQFRGPHVLLDDPKAFESVEVATGTRPRPEDPAYVIYTSGSTGQPKGVVVNHRNLFRLFSATDHWFKFDSTDAWTLFHSIAFDFSVWELWGALAFGGRLVVVPYAVSRSPQDFYRLLCNRGVTVLNQTPSAFRQLVRAEEVLGASRDLALRYVIFGGEALELQSLGPWFDRHAESSPQLVNMYGITETTVHVTYRPIRCADLATSSTGSPIGRPIPDLTVHVLGEDRSPAAVGEIGEMYVGGAGVACGYLNRPELTEERFLRDPFSSDPSAKLYRSGDLARVLPDGQLEFHGRADSQVKIRGFRIEVGEIESLLAKQCEVAEAAVVVEEDGRGDRRLVAYASARDGRSIDSADLRARLKESLPDYMVPSSIVVLASLPLTTNGKIDRAALVASEQARLEPKEPARTIQGSATERQVAEIWARSLRCNVGLDDNFFDIGGTSLHLAEVHAELSNARGDVPITLLFEYPTVRSLARQLDGAAKQDAAMSVTAERARMQRVALARRRTS